MKTLPSGVAYYARSPEFSDKSIPENLLESHRTKTMTWAKIVVTEGKILYRILEPRIEEHELSPDRSGVVEPEVPHELEVMGDVRFHLDFYR